VNLKRYIKLVVEAAVSGEAAVKDKLALFRTQQSGRVLYVLYNPSTVVKEVQKPDFGSMRFSQPIDSLVMGFMEALPHSGDCNDALEVKRSAAVKGYGPLLYDIAMSDGDGGLMPDRVDTSEPAKKVWKFYATQRSGEVDRNPFDDEDEKKTKSTDDDCSLVKDDSDLLNYSYDGPGQSGPKADLMSRHDLVASKIEEKLKVKRAMLEAALLVMGRNFFKSKKGDD
jgi:hypothetical protein